MGIISKNRFLPSVGTMVLFGFFTSAIELGLRQFESQIYAYFYRRKQQLSLGGCYPVKECEAIVAEYSRHVILVLSLAITLSLAFLFVRWKRSSSGVCLVFLPALSLVMLSHKQSVLWLAMAFIVCISSFLIFKRESCMSRSYSALFGLTISLVTAPLLSKYIAVTIGKTSSACDYTAGGGSRNLCYNSQLQSWLVFWFLFAVAGLFAGYFAHMLKEKQMRQRSHKA